MLPVLSFTDSCLRYYFFFLPDYFTYRTSRISIIPAMVVFTANFSRITAFRAIAQA
jgi:hypothetical protein